MKNNVKKNKSCCKPENVLPHWHEVMPSNPSYHLKYKTKRRKKNYLPNLKSKLNQNYNLKNKKQLSQSLENILFQKQNNNNNSGKFKLF